MYGAHLTCISWNVRGVRREEAEKFLDDMHEDRKWDVLLLHEFSKARTDWPAEISGHRVYCRASSGGSRQPAIIVHRESTKWIQSDAMQQGFSMGLLDVCLILVCLLFARK